MSSTLQQAVSFLRDVVAPRANEIDKNPAALIEVFQQWGETGFAALKVPPAYGGPGMDETEFRQFQVEAARASGAFAFLQTQHQSAASMLLRSNNESLKQAYLPRMVQGQTWVGIGFSQLRRPGPPVMRATPANGGYQLDGTVPWLTGYGIFPEFLIGATLPSGEAIFGIVPFYPEAGIEFTKPMELVVMEAAQTVAGSLYSYIMPEEKVAFIKPHDWIANNDRINITLQGHFALGCAMAGLDILKQNAESRNSEMLHAAWEAMNRELGECRARIESSQADASEESTPERLRLRAWAIELAARCSHAGIVSSAGGAGSMSNPAQRVYREAIVFSVSAQTAEIMEVTLDRLARPRG